MSRFDIINTPEEYESIIESQKSEIESLKARIEELEKDKPLEVCKCGDIKDVIYCSKCKKVWQVY